MLRSASTPLFQSLLSSFSEGPVHGGSPFADFPHPSITKIHYRSNLQIGLKLFSGTSYPDGSSKGMKRAQSEGNLESLVRCNDDARPLATTSKKIQGKSFLKLEKILSFSCTGKDREDDESEEEDKPSEVTSFFKSVTRPVSKGQMEVLESTLDKGRTMVVDGGISNGFGGRSGGGNDDMPSRFHSGGGDEEINQTDENYRRLLDKDPANALILRNYAEFLHQSKGDLIGAEAYCSRAILADPTDGDILSLYAQLSWRLYRDEEKTIDYFDRAAKASPNNSYVHAAYARFLWELDEEDDGIVTPPLQTTPSHFQFINAV